MDERFRIDVINKTNINIRSGNYVFLNESWSMKDVCNPFTRLYFVRNGNGFLKTDKETVFLEGGYVYMIPAEFNFSYGCTNLEKIFFHITVPTLEKYDLFCGISEICRLPFPEERFKELLDCFESEDYHEYLRLKAILLGVVLDFAEKYNFEKVMVKQYSELVQKIMSYIEKNLAINMSVAGISSDLFVSPCKIRNSFKDEIGITIGKYIDDMVFIKAKQMLSENDKSISEISDMFGFCDQFYFSRRFKEKFGMTPSEFKKRMSII